MRHEGADHGTRFAAPQARWRVVDSLVKSEPSGYAFGGQLLQVKAGGFGRDHQREGGSIGRNDQIVAQTALQSQSGHAECAILVIELDIDSVVAGFRNTPRNAAFLPYSICRFTAAL